MKQIFLATLLSLSVFASAQTPEMYLKTEILRCLRFTKQAVSDKQIFQETIYSDTINISIHIKANGRVNPYKVQISGPTTLGISHNIQKALTNFKLTKNIKYIGGKTLEIPIVITYELTNDNYKAPDRIEQVDDPVNIPKKYFQLNNMKSKPTYQNKHLTISSIKNSSYTKYVKGKEGYQYFITIKPLL